MADDPHFQNLIQNPQAYMITDLSKRHATIAHLVLLNHVAQKKSDVTDVVLVAVSQMGVRR